MRGVHRAFLLDDDEKSHAVELLRRDHHGTMFEGRYHERNHKTEPEVMLKTSAYIDIHAWKAGIARRPEDYEWCSFAAAVKGDEKARVQCAPTQRTRSCASAPTGCPSALTTRGVSHTRVGSA